MFKKILTSFLILLLISVAGLGCGQGQKSVPGLERFYAGVLQENLYVSFVSTTLHWDVGLTAPIPGLESATLSVSPDLATTGTVFQFSIALSTLLNNGKPLPLSGLPGGRAIPDVQGGLLPRWDAQIGGDKGIDFSLYLSNEAFGLFIPLSFLSPKGVPLSMVVSVRIEDERGNLLGKAYAMPANKKSNPNRTESDGSGLFILLPYLGSEPISGKAK